MKVTAPAIEADAEIIRKLTSAVPVAVMVRSKPVLPWDGGPAVKARLIDKVSPGFSKELSPWSLSMVALFAVFVPQLIVKVMLPVGMHIKRAHVKSSEPETVKVKPAHIAEAVAETELDEIPVQTEKLNKPNGVAQVKQLLRRP